MENHNDVTLDETSSWALQTQTKKDTLTTLTLRGVAQDIDTAARPLPLLIQVPLIRKIVLALLQTSPLEMVHVNAQALQFQKTPIFQL